MRKQWTVSGAVNLIKKIEEIAKDCGAHIALTGGLLYKEGERKDLDLVVYRIRQRPSIRWNEFYVRLSRELKVNVTEQRGWVTKAEYEGLKIDFFDPEYRDQPTDRWDGDGEGY